MIECPLCGWTYGLWEGRHAFSALMKHMGDEHYPPNGDGEFWYAAICPWCSERIESAEKTYWPELLAGHLDKSGDYMAHIAQGLLGISGTVGEGDD